MTRLRVAEGEPLPIFRYFEPSEHEHVWEQTPGADTATCRCGRTARVLVATDVTKPRTLETGTTP